MIGNILILTFIVRGENNTQIIAFTNFTSTLILAFIAITIIMGNILILTFVINLIMESRLILTFPLVFIK